MKTFLMLLTLVLLATASVVTATNFAIQPQLETRLNLERTAKLKSGTLRNAQKAYELRCRGGGLRFNSTPGRTLPTGEQLMNVTVNFVAGTQGAGNRAPKLNPGQCSWVDRGFRQGEPGQIRLEMVSFAQQKQVLHGSTVDRSPTAAERYPDAQNVPPYLSSSNRYWSFWVYNTNNGYLQATASKFWKPSPIIILPKDKIKVGPAGKTGTSNVNKRD